MRLSRWMWESWSVAVMWRRLVTWLNTVSSWPLKGSVCVCVVYMCMLCGVCVLYTCACCVCVCVCVCVLACYVCCCLECVWAHVCCVCMWFCCCFVPVFFVLFLSLSACIVVVLFLSLSACIVPVPGFYFPFLDLFFVPVILSTFLSIFSLFVSLGQ